MATNDPLRKHVLDLLALKGAHLNFDEAVDAFPVALRGRKPAGAPHTPWQLLEHLRIAQWDILEFSRDAKHVSPEWPSGYWPKIKTPPNPQAWNKTIRAFTSDNQAMRKLVAAKSTDLHAPIPHGQGQTSLREVLLIADHNAYHLGELLLVRRLLGAWK